MALAFHLTCCARTFIPGLSGTSGTIHVWCAACQILCCILSSAVRELNKVKFQSKMYQGADVGLLHWCSYYYLE